MWNGIKHFLKITFPPSSTPSLKPVMCRYQKSSPCGCIAEMEFETSVQLPCSACMVDAVVGKASVVVSNDFQWAGKEQAVF